MKPKAGIASLFIIGSIPLFSLFAQQANDNQQQLIAKSVKQARKEAKKYAKEGYYVAPGALSIEKQLENAWMKQNETDSFGSPRYIIESGNAIAETRTIAKIQADEIAKLNIASAVNSRIISIVESNIGTMQLNAEDAASVTKTVETSGEFIIQELGMTITIAEFYRDVGEKSVEADVRLAYDYRDALSSSKSALRKKLKEETKLLQEQVDEILKY